MSVSGFQQAFCDLIASPEMSVGLRRGEASLLDGYELTARERRRLIEAVRQRGMSVNCTLYRHNRVTPLCSLLPRSCALLDDRFREEASAYWRAEATDLQFGPEIERFASFLRARLDSGALNVPYLDEMLGFELAINELRFAPRLRLLADLEERRAGRDWELHPLVRVLRFAYEPEELLGSFSGGDLPPAGLQGGDFYLVLDGTDAELVLRPLEPRWGKLLAGLEPGTSVSGLAEPGKLAPLASAHLLVPV